MAAVGKGNEKPTSKKKESTRATISEDLAEGQTAKLDASLKIISEDRQTFLRPTHERGDPDFMIGTSDNYTTSYNQTQTAHVGRMTRKQLLLSKQKRDSIYTVERKEVELNPTGTSISHDKGAQITSRMPVHSHDTRDGTATKKRKRKRGNRSENKSSDVDESQNVASGKDSDADEGVSAEVGAECS